MSVIQQARAGDEIVVIQGFNVSPEGEKFAWATSRKFRIGERVRLVGFFQDQHYKDLPGLGWTVTFEGADSKRYAATQTYFVTEECWQKMKRFFARRLMRDPGKKRKKEPFKGEIR